MRVLHILSGDLWAGAEVMVRNLLLGLRAYDDLELRVAILNRGQPAREIESLGIETVVIEESRKPFLELLSALRKALKEFQPRIVHSHRYKENLLAYLASRGMKRVGLIRTQHGMPERHGRTFSIRAKSLQYLDLRILTRCYHSTVAVSEEMRSGLLSEFKCRPHKLEVIHNGIHPPRTSRRKGKHFVIGTCGRLSPVKNYSLFISTAARLHQHGQDMRFELVGDGPDRDLLQAAVRECGLEEVFRFRGHLQSMENFYSGLDLYVNTSLHEGIPMSVLEAMGHGVPIIAPEVGGFKEIISPGFEGFLIARHDPDAFAARCLELYDKPDLKKKMGEHAKQTVMERFSLRNMAEGYYQAYNRLEMMS